ncbi:MAG: hypothetical protein ACLGIR_07560 [Actinomycetes bacterium]
MTPEHPQAAGSTPGAVPARTDDRLTAIRDELEALDGVALAERPEVFERVHRVLVAELNALEEV